MKRFKLVILFIFISAYSFAQDATEIVKRADEKMRGESSYAEMTMRIVRPDWTREISMKSWSLGREYALILITAPAREEGIAYLKRGNEIWNWQPSIDRVVKLPPSMMSQSWMGSDFTNNDLVEESSIVTDYNHKLLGDSTVNGRLCYKIEMIPKEEAAVVWGKIISYISKDDYFELLTRFYDEDMYLINILTAADIQQMDDREIPTKLTMEPADEEGNETILLYQDAQFNIDITEDFFSIQNMKQLRP